VAAPKCGPVHAPGRAAGSLTVRQPGRLSPMIPWLFLTVTCLGALFTLNAFVPVRRNRLLFFPSFFASWLTIELALFHIVWEIAAVVVFVWLGALDAWPGWVGLAIAVVNWVALLVIVARSRATAALGEKALETLSGDHHLDPVHRNRVRKVRNIPYRRVAGRTVKLDVFTPHDPPPDGVRRPALLQIHGGGWVIGDKREQGIPLLKYLASHGWVGFNANYRLSPGSTWPDHLVDLKHALAWIREHADDYGVDPDFIAVTGGSAGGHLAAMMALTANDPEYQDGIEEADTSLQAAVPFYGVYDLTNRNGRMPAQFVPWFVEPLILKKFLADHPEDFAKASPLDCIHADAPPFFVIHGDKDTLAPVDDARDFTRCLGEVSESPVFYLELHGAQHAFDVFTSMRTRRVVKSVHRFLSVIHARYRAGVAPEDMEPAEAEMTGGTVRIDEPADVERAAS
jgi:acetyl esterase/lipase